LEAGKALSAKAEGIYAIKWENGKAILQIGSGDYQFNSIIK